MIQTTPEVIKSGRYTQADCARILGISRQTVAKYENLGLIGFRVIKPMMRKVTTGADILRFWERLMR